MKFTTLGGWLGGRGQSRRTHRRDDRKRLAFERLEDRVQPALAGGVPEVALTAAAHYWADGQQIDLDESPDRVDSHGRHRSVIAESGVVHQDIDVSERIESLGCEPLAVHR